MSSNKVIAIHTWDPGLLVGGDKKASSGGSSWLKFLIQQLSFKGHNVLWVSNNEEDVVEMTHTVTVEEAAKQADALFIPWRWKMPAYPERNALYASQMLLIENARGKIIIHDEDHMMTMEESKFCISKGALLTAPELFPKPGFRQLIFPYPFDGLEIQPSWDMFKEYDLRYIGNNYGRLEQTIKYLGQHDDLKVNLVGNWMTPHPERETPEKIKSLINATFTDKVANDAVVLELSKAWATVHLAKPSYCGLGFVTMRWAEACAAGIPSIVPSEFRLNGRLHDEFIGMYAKNSERVSKLVQEFKLSRAFYETSVERQLEAVKSVFSIEPWLEILGE